MAQAPLFAFEKSRNIHIIIGAIYIFALEGGKKGNKKVVLILIFLHKFQIPIGGLRPNSVKLFDISYPLILSIRNFDLFVGPIPCLLEFIS